MESKQIAIKNIDKIRRFNIFHNTRHNRTIEMIVSPEQQLERIRNKNIRLVTREELYKHGTFEFKNKIYEHYDEVEICCNNDEQQVILDLITQESYHKLKEQGYNLVHLELIMIGVLGLHRQGLGTKVMIFLVDTRHLDSFSKAIIALMELDMSTGIELSYITPNYAINISSFQRYISILK